MLTSALFYSSPDLLTHPVAAGSEAETVSNDKLGFELIRAEKNSRLHCLQSQASLLSVASVKRFSCLFFFLCASRCVWKAHVAALSGMGSLVALVSEGYVISDTILGVQIL